MDNIEAQGDDSMSPIDNEITETDSRMKQIGGNISHPSKIDESIAQLIDLSDSGIIHEPTCLLCSSPYREEIENKWVDSKQSYSLVKDFIREKTGFDISKAIVENHMIYHLNRGTKEIQKGEYANKIKRLNDNPLSSMDLLNLGIAALQERLIGVNSLTPGGDFAIADIEKIKTQETTRITAGMTQLVKMQDAILNDMKKNGEILSVAKQPFIKIFNEALIDAKTDAERNLINDILDKISALSKI